MAGVLDNLNITIVDVGLLRDLTNSNISHVSSVIAILDLTDPSATQFIAPSHNGGLSSRVEVCIKYLDDLIRGYSDLALPILGKRYCSLVFQGDDRPVDEISVSWQTQRSFKRVGLVPDFYYTMHRGYRAFLPDEVVNWIDRLPTVFWRGATTGGFNLTTESVRSLLRYRLCEFSSSLGEKVDFGIYTVAQALPGESAKEIEDLLTQKKFFKRAVDLEQFTQYKFFVQIDGNGNAWDLIKKLRLGCCMLLVDSEWVLWHYDRLVPWEHYVPVKADLSDFKEIVDWCLTNDDKAMDIASNGRKFALSLDFDLEMNRAFHVLVDNSSEDLIDPLLK